MGRTQTRQPDSALQDVLLVPEVAELKHVDETTVIRAIQDGKLPGEKRGRVYLVHRRDLRYWTPDPRGRKPTGRGKSPRSAAAETPAAGSSSSQQEDGW